VTFVLAAQIPVLRGVKRDGKVGKKGNEVDRRCEVGQANAELPTPRFSTACQPQKTSFKVPLFFKNNNTAISYVPEQSIPDYRSRHDTHIFQTCVMDADVVRLPSLLSLGGPCPVLSPAQTGSITQTAS
jgi:hypothetical protein